MGLGLGSCAGFKVVHLRCGFGLTKSFSGF